MARCLCRTTCATSCTRASGSSSRARRWRPRQADVCSSRKTRLTSACASVRGDGASRRNHLLPLKAVGRTISEATQTHAHARTRTRSYAHTRLPRPRTQQVLRAQRFRRDWVQTRGQRDLAVHHAQRCVSVANAHARAWQCGWPRGGNCPRFLVAGLMSAMMLQTPSGCVSLLNRSHVVRTSKDIRREIEVP